MNIFVVLNNLIHDKITRFNYMVELGFYNKLSDEVFLRKKYNIVYNCDLNIEDPNTYSEKLQWLKLHDRKTIYTTMVDKVEVKKYVASIIGENYIIPTIKVYDSVDEINFDELPNKFVLKCNHNSGKGMYICRNKKEINERKVRRNLKKGLRQDYYLTN